MGRGKGGIQLGANNTGLYPDVVAFLVYFQDLIHPTEIEDNASLHGQDSSGDTGSRSPGDDGNSLPIGNLKDLNDLPGVLGKDNRVGYTLVYRHVPAVTEPFHFIRMNILSPNDLFQNGGVHHSLQV